MRLRKNDIVEHIETGSIGVVVTSSPPGLKPGGIGVSWIVPAKGQPSYRASDRPWDWQTIESNFRLICRPRRGHVPMPEPGATQMEESK